MASKRPAKYLPDEERFRLRFGPYEPPIVKRGYLVDAVRGKLPFSRFSNGRIPWPIARRQGPAGSGGYILCGDLIRALKTEAGPAIAYHWGVCSDTVTKWKAAIGAPAMTKGACLISEMGRGLVALRQVRSKMSKAARRRPFRPALKESLITGSRKRYDASAEARKAAYSKTGKFPKVRGNKVAWIPEEEVFLGTKTIPELSQLLGRTPEAIIARHSFRKIPVKFPPDHARWSSEDVKLLGSASDSAVAAATGRTVTAVQLMRSRKGIVGDKYHFPIKRENAWTARELSMLGKWPDHVVARRIKRTLEAVAAKRLRLRIPPARRA